ncbi:MAG: hypothetical protein QM757_21540 [Paludibaculum sp.]
MAYGLGVNSTALLVELARRDIRPDRILFADTGGEKPETYRYLPVVQAFLERVKFPPVVTVRYQPVTAPCPTLEGRSAHRHPASLAYGGKSCSVKWKRQPQDRYILAGRVPAGRAGRRRPAGGTGDRVRRRRGPPADLGPVSGTAGRRPSRQAWLDAHYFAYWYPLVDWGAGPGRVRSG